MKKILVIFILFFSIANSSFGQESNSDINRLSNLINSDSLANNLMNNFISKFISNAERQIQGAGAKEKLDTYTKFIIATTTEISNSFTTTMMPLVYSKHFTPEEIKDLIVFYETPTGKKLLSEMTKIISSLRYGVLENPVIYSMKLTRENKKDLREFYKTTTGKKLEKEMDMIINKLMTSLASTYIPNFETKIKKELQRLDSKIWREAYQVKPEQVTVYNGKFSESTKVVRIKNNLTTNETYVTYTVPIYENKFWIRFDKSTEIIDEDSNDHYKVIRLDKDFVLNKTMIVSDQKNKMIEVTLVFPLLKKSVKSIAIVEKVSDDADLMSNNSGGGDNALNYIKVKDYTVD